MCALHIYVCVCSMQQFPYCLSDCFMRTIRLFAHSIRWHCSNRLESIQLLNETLEIRARNIESSSASSTRGKIKAHSDGDAFDGTQSSKTMTLQKINPFSINQPTILPSICDGYWHNKSSEKLTTNKQHVKGAENE